MLPFVPIVDELLEPTFTYRSLPALFRYNDYLLFNY